MTPAEAIRDLRKKQNEEYEKAKQTAQTYCQHSEVLHDDGHRSFGTYHPERRCVDCGYTEVGGWWCYSPDCLHWHDKDDHGKKVLASKEGRNIREASEDEFRQAAV